VNEATTMVKLVGRRTGVVVDTDDLAQDGAFDSIDAFWAATLRGKNRSGGGRPSPSLEVWMLSKRWTAHLRSETMTTTTSPSLL
jgi:hypothetical protein